VHGLLDLLVRGAEELRGLGVEEAAVVALGLRVEADADEFLVLVRDERLAEFDLLEDLPLRAEQLGRDPLEEVRDKAQGLLDVGLDLAAVHRGSSHDSYLLSGTACPTRRVRADHELEEAGSAQA
jgi:hypothetical protein